MILIKNVYKQVRDVKKQRKNPILPNEAVNTTKYRVWQFMSLVRSITWEKAD